MTARITWLRGLHGMRDGVLEQLTDADLGFCLGGDNVSIGQLFQDLADLEQSYVASLRDQVQRWPDREDVRGAPTPSELTRRFAALDAELEAAFTNAEEATDVAITRPEGEVRTPDEQADIYTQALFIFLGKAVVHLRAMSRQLPPSVAHYIG